MAISLFATVDSLNQDMTTDNIPFFGEEKLNYVHDETELPQLFYDDDTGLLQELIVKMTDYDPDRRPKATQIVKELQNIIGKLLKITILAEF